MSDTEYEAQVAAVLTDAGTDVDAVDTGTADNTYTAGNTKQKSVEYSGLVLIIEDDSTNARTGALVTLFSSAAGATRSEFYLTEGVHHYPFKNYGLKIKNRTAGANVIWQAIFLS